MRVFLKKIIRKRDDYQCQMCFIHQEELLIETNRSLSIHHIDYNKKNSKLNNLISLCNNCHIQTNRNRVFWENYFNIFLKNGIGIN